MNVTNYIPQTLIGIGIVAVGIYLIRGKKKELDQISADVEGGENKE